MPESILFFIDSCIIKGEIPVEEIERKLPVKRIRAIHLHQTYLDLASDKRIVKKVNQGLRRLNQETKKRIEAFLISRDRDFQEFQDNQWDFLEQGPAPNFHLIRIELKGEVRRQEQRQVHRDYGKEKKKVDPEKVKLVRKKMKETIVEACREVLASVHS